MRNFFGHDSHPTIRVDNDFKLGEGLLNAAQKLQKLQKTLFGLLRTLNLVTVRVLTLRAEVQKKKRYMDRN